nr:hypothetical protein [Tanacetum cinerariifolium]
MKYLMTHPVLNLELKKEKEGLDRKVIGFESASKDLDTLIGSQRSDKNKEGLRYGVVPPPAQAYSPPKKDMSWTGSPEFKDDTITDYSRPSPSIQSNSSDLQRTDSPTVIKSSKTEIARKSPVKYAEMYKNTTKSLKPGKVISMLFVAVAQTARPKAVINRFNDVKASAWQLRDKIGRFSEDKKNQSAKEFPLVVYFTTVSAKVIPLLIEDQINININAD